jgi:hypothetical protein
MVLWERMGKMLKVCIQCNKPVKHKHKWKMVPNPFYEEGVSHWGERLAKQHKNCDHPLESEPCPGCGLRFE